MNLEELDTVVEQIHKKFEQLGPLVSYASRRVHTLGKTGIATRKAAELSECYSQLLALWASFHRLLGELSDSP